MNIKSTETRDVSPQQLAEALAKGTPKEFAEFWFRFDEFCEKENVDLDKFAEAMFPNFGGSRKRPLKKIFKFMEYLEIKNIKD